VRKRSFAIVHRLLASEVKLVVVACNTASAAAVADLRQAFEIPFVGMVPGVKPAAQRSRNGHVAILATEGTFDGDLYSRVVEDFGRGATIRAVPGTGLAALVERGLSGSAEARAAIQRVLGQEVRAGADTVVLGCTHYHYLAADIAAEFPNVDIVDTSESVARRAVQVLDESGMRAPADQTGEVRLIVSGDRHEFEQAMTRAGIDLRNKETVTG
jgi:glutamate racemase